MSEKNLVLTAKIKQPKITNQFMKLIASGHLSHAYLLIGGVGVGELDVAKTSAMRIYCQNVQDNFPCGECFECQRILNGEHPDVVEIKPEGQTIKVEQIRYIKREFSKSGLEGSKKIFIIQDANKMTNSAANSLLKFIEEPIGNTTIFLISQEKNQILPTIISRTQVIDFPNLDLNLLKSELKNAKILPNQVNLLLSITNDMNQILVWNENNWFERVVIQIGNWFTYLEKNDAMAFPLIQSDLMPLISNRNQQDIVIDVIVELFKELLEVKVFNVNEESTKFLSILNIIKDMAEKLPYQKIISILEIILDIKKQQKVNVNFQNIMEATTLQVIDIIQS
ncbi:DNA polymerase III subunit delta' [Lentilactobacillus laojiaonis]|uniref:DNA polymerase III subunit delta' n=1 Tax=Lentilactobacillus laojiaonis TaxID=2883998 RepID=UPI001D0B7086|nr:DNA polymerase III subunit delta' [Lentilactobacillus laojiaonis]UDM31852.1 DNA polymerase III subunit delta' [Lentilactobacillus laojiaonis]